MNANDDPPFTRVRPINDRNLAVQLLPLARRLSPSLDGLIVALEATDLFVYIDVRVHLGGHAAYLEYVGGSPSARVIRISVCAMKPLATQVSLLAHELQHALEIARAPEARDARTLRHLFCAIGWELHSKTSTFDTEAARTIERAALREVRNPGLRRVPATQAPAGVTTLRIP